MVYAVVRLKVAGSTPPGDTDPVSSLKLPLAATTNYDKPVRNHIRTSAEASSGH